MDRNSSGSSAVQVGFDALAKDDYVAARQAFELAQSEDGGKEVLVHLGWLLEEGLGGPKDLVKAKRLYRAALDRDPPLASYHLGLMLMKEDQPEEAARLLGIASDAGNPSAAYWLYALNSKAVDRESQERAEQSLLRAAELGHIYARRDLARRQVKSTRGLMSKIGALFQYWKMKRAGMVLIVRNANDWRVR